MMERTLRSLYIYLTDACNLSCIHCWQSAPLAGEGKYSRLKFKDCKPFLDSARELGLQNIILSGGEPLLNPDFHLFAEYFQKKQCSTTIETNGMLISKPGIFDAIIDYNVYCAISLDGLSEDTHNKQRNNHQAFEQTMQAIRKLDDAGHYYQIIMAISKLNEHEFVPLLDWVKENCKFCNAFKINIVNARGRGEDMMSAGLLFSGKDVVNLGKAVGELAGKLPFQVFLHIDPAFVPLKGFRAKYTCGGHCGYRNSLSVLANGAISICSMGKQVPEYLFGHVSTIDIADTWKSHPKLLDIYDSMEEKLQGVCSNCIFRKSCFGGCRADAFCTYGDFFAPHPFCQDYYNSGEFPKSRLIDPKKDCRYPA